MHINKMLTPFNRIKQGDTGRIKYIVIHYVGATGGAEANCRYYASKYIGASAHYFVGFNGEIWQSVEDGDIAWHCGAKSYAHPECRNSNSIGIELCVRNKGNKADNSRDWYFEDATVQSAIRLTRKLMAQYNIPIDHVIRHYDVTGKICPNPFVYNNTAHTWDAFKVALAMAETATVGWEKDSRGKYKCRKENGEYVTSEWRLINHHWYWFGTDGIMLTGWQKINDKWYYLEESGEFEGACWHETAEHDGSLERWDVK